MEPNVTKHSAACYRNLGAWRQAFRWVRGLDRTTGCSPVSWGTYDREDPTCKGLEPTSNEKETTK